MIARSVDVNDPEWIQMRDQQWVRMEEKLVDCRYSKKRRAVLRELFYGQIDSYTDSRLNIIDNNERGYLFINLNPHQCQKNWEWVIRGGWNDVNPKKLHKSELEVYARYVHKFVHGFYRANLEWTLEEQLACFKFLFGDTYRPDDFCFLGHSIKHPLDPYWVLSHLAVHVNYILIGEKYIDCIWTRVYQYCIDAFRYVDTTLFLPDSKELKENRVDAKVWWCVLLKTLCNHKKVYNKYKKDGFQDEKYRSVCFQEYIQKPDVSALLKALDADMRSGVIPKEIGVLKELAAVDSVELFRHELKDYTLSPSMSFANLKEKLAPKKVEKTPVRKKKPVEPLLNIDPSKEKMVCAGLEAFRQFALQEELFISDQPFDSVQKYLNWAKPHGMRLSNTSIMSLISRLNAIKNKSDRDRSKVYAKILEASNTGYIQLDVFGVCSPGSINTEYRNAWKELFRLVGSAITVKSLRVNKKGSMDDGYDIKVTIVTSKQSHVFNYTMDSDWLDESLLSDANVFAEKEGLRWRYQIDDCDGGVELTYLSPTMMKLL